MTRGLCAVVALGLLLACSACSTCSGSRKDGVDAGTASTGSTGALSPELEAKLAEARLAKGPAYVPNTHHKNADGSPIYTNRLILEASPYLLQHAHNPVSWFPWGTEAFETARRLGRPVLLSIGYSTCHWCHVMEEESFEDLEVARYLNENYVAIKVDREERPDVDAIYMSAVQSLTGGGGWPMTVWLTPDKRPFYGGTYFPARDGDRGTRVGFLSLLGKLKTTYDEDPSKVVASATQIAAAIEKRMSPQAGAVGQRPTASVLESAASMYRARFDEVNGGLRGAPKFPSSLPVSFLLRQHRRSASADLLRMARLTLEKMAAGGIYDHVGGGFHRYATDATWLVPHFEKMLYDNALLVIAYLEGFQVTHDPELARTAREVLRYVERDMTAPSGAFYSATDADSADPRGHLEEGRFFTWTPTELEGALGAPNAREVIGYYGVTTTGDLEGRSILRVGQAARAESFTLDSRAPSNIDALRDTLYAARAKRTPPRRDEKILTAWNGLMISALARAASVLGERTYAERAERAASFVLTSLRRDGRLLRSSMDGRAKHNAYLDDYAFLIAGLLDLYEATGAQRWLDEAIALDATLEAHHEDRGTGGFFMTSDDHEKLLAREKPSYDGAEPSGNSVEARNLLRLHELTTNDRYRARAERLLGFFSDTLRESPTSLSTMLLAVDFYVDVPKAIVIVTGAGGRADAEPLLAKLRSTFLPNHALLVVRQGEALAQLARVTPLVEGKVARGEKATAYVCEKGACQLPTTDPEVFSRQLSARAPTR